MRKILLATTAMAFALGSAAPAFAADLKVGADTDTKVTTESGLIKSGAGVQTDSDAGARIEAKDPASSSNTSVDSGLTTENAAGNVDSDAGARIEGKDPANSSNTTVDSGLSTENAAGNIDSDAGARVEGGAQMTSDSDFYRSYNQSGDFDGSIAGGFSATDLIGADIVDASGETVGEVADILIDADNKAERVLVDVGGFLGLGEKRIALPISDLSRNGDVLVSAKTQADLEAMSAYREDKDGWLLEGVN